MRLLNDHVCPICGNEEVSYYCESCSSLFCTSCVKVLKTNYAVCDTCGTIYHLDPPLNKPFFCKSCKGTVFRVGVKRSLLCPQCGSNNVVSVLRKKELQLSRVKGLGSDFLDVSPFMMNVLNALSKIKARLLKLRRNGFLHHPDLEEAIINSYASFSSLKLKALSRVERIVSGLASSIINLFREWSPLKIKEIDAYLDQVSGAVEEYKGFVKDECQSIISKIREVSAVIDYLEFHHNFFERFKSILDLKDHERPVCVIPEVKYTGSDFLSSDKGEGLLFFTSERAIFIRREGLLKKMFKRQFSFPLNDVELLVKRGLRRAFILKTGKGKVCFTSSRHVIEKIESYFELAKNFKSLSLADDTLTKRLESMSVGLNDFKRKITSLMHSLLNPKKAESEHSQQVPSHLNIPFPPSLPPPRPSCSVIPPYRNENDRRKELLLLEKERFAVEQNLKKLEELWDKGEISLEDYFKLSRKFKGELYELNAKIQELTCRL